jgi:cell division protein FtsL
MAAAAAAIRGRQQMFAPSRRCWVGTPEVFFAKHIDNSRLVKVDDPMRKREMRMFTVALCMLFTIVMMYAWQHFSAIEYGYKIEALSAKRTTLTESNRQLRLDLALLKDPERIDQRAKDMGLQLPDASQVQQLDSSPADMGGPVMARADVRVVSTP